MRQNVMQRMWMRRIAFSDERGVSLVESLIAVTIVGIALTALVATLSTGSIAVQRSDKRVTAENLARAQLEYTKGQAYRIAPALYDTLTPLPAGYSISAEASSISGRDADIQKITVTVSYNGDSVLVMEDFKMDR